jgi:uncharacterized metal-binding protein YceD (DUF177 family)
MKIKAHLIPEEGLHLQGEDPPTIMDLSENLFKFEKPIKFDLEATWVGDDSIFFQGTISTIVCAQCVRTLEWFDLPIVIKEFKAHKADITNDEVDLTEQIREDILLLLPTNPVSPKAKPLKTKMPVKKEEGSKVWRKLDQLKLK